MRRGGASLRVCVPPKAAINDKAYPNLPACVIVEISIAAVDWRICAKRRGGTFKWTAKRSFTRTRT